jgi:hypothetical protein
MSSQTEIANLALRRFGQSRITDINQTSPAAEAIRDVWDNSRRAALRAHHWNFATRPAVLTASATAPLFRWAKAYPLPVDYLRLVSCNCVPSGTKITCYEVRGDELLSNESKAEIEYVADITNCELWDNQFVDAFSYKLAAEIAPSIMSDGGAVAAQLAAAEFQRLLMAMSSDHIETKPLVVNALRGSAYQQARCEYADSWPWPGDGIPLEYDVSFNPYNVGP